MGSAEIEMMQVGSTRARSTVDDGAADREGAIETAIGEAEGKRGSGGGSCRSDVLMDGLDDEGIWPSHSLGEDRQERPVATIGWLRLSHSLPRHGTKLRQWWDAQRNAAILTGHTVRKKVDILTTKGRWKGCAALSCSVLHALSTTDRDIRDNNKTR